MHKPAEPVGDSGGGEAVQEALTDLVNAEANIIQLGDAVPNEETCKIVRDDIDDIHDDADGEAEDDEERY